jgi:argininosuccinate lyase
MEWIDKNPLGTAAGYGVNLPLDREFCTTKLGFARLHCSPIAAQLSRGKFEMAALEGNLIILKIKLIIFISILHNFSGCSPFGLGFVTFFHN